MIERLVKPTTVAHRATLPLHMLVNSLMAGPLRFRFLLGKTLRRASWCDVYGVAL